MPNSVPGGAVPNVTETADKSWWSFRHFNPRTAEDPRLSYITGYQRGYRDALNDTAQFASLQVSVERLANLLEDGRIEREAVQMAVEHEAARMAMQDH
jgi:hypothetical protein